MPVMPVMPVNLKILEIPEMLEMLEDPREIFLERSADLAPFLLHFDGGVDEEEAVGGTGEGGV